MTTYRAWDGNDYPSPPPDGWYEGSDELWWPEGYGPGPAVEEPAPAAPPMPPPSASSAPPPVLGVPGAPSAGSTDPTTVLPTVAPSAAAPGMAAPGMTAPGMAAPSAAAPGMASPGMTPPGMAPPGMSPPPGMPAPGYEPAGAAPADWSQPAGAAPPAAAPAGAKKSKAGLLIGLACLIFALIFGSLAYLYMTSSDDGGVVAFDPSATPGSAANPHLAGESVRLSFDDPETGAVTEWTIEVLDAPTDQAITAGDTEAVVELALTLVAADGPQSLSAFTFQSVSVDGSRTSSSACETVSTALPDARQVSIGETIEGAVCWKVPSKDASSLAMMVEVDGVDGQVHMKLH